MRNDDQKPQGAVPRARQNNGLIPNSLRAFSSYLRIVSSGASTVASTVRSAASAASAIVDRENEVTNDQVYWAGFDKLEYEGDVAHRVLLLGYRFGFQVWDVEEANNVRKVMSRYDGPVSFMRILPKPIASKQSGDKFADSRPLLAICADGSFTGGGYVQDGSAIPNNGSIQNCHDQLNGGFVPTVVWFYSLISQSYVRVLKFRSVVYSVRCSPRVVAVLQAAQVIVRDVIGKSVISQFRAHNSPISSLCFDPSGTLLVTASVQGHNINAFRIMPELSGSSSGSVSGASYVHLYKLQRGITHAVIQDISFSEDSHWIMISSSRGTSHLFGISLSGGTVNFQSSDAFVTTKNSGSGAVTKPAVCGPPNSGLQMLNQQTLCASGPPIILSAVSRIRSGNNGWRSTVSGAAAAATGRMSSLCVAIASAFHNGKSNNLCADTSYLKAKYHLLVFSSPGCVIQYALHTSSGLDGVAVISGLSPTCELAPECDARIVVEAIQKWNICQKQNRRELEDNIDIYGENGNSNISKIYPEGKQNENIVFPEVKVTSAKVKISPEERHHMYISEAELQMHLPRAPLWARSEIYFQSMIKDGIKVDEEDASGGEIQIERIPTRMIEARSKDLVPVFDYLKMPKFQLARVPASENNNNGWLLHQKLGISDNGGSMSRSSSGSLDAVDGSVTVGEFQNGIEKTGLDGLRMAIENT